MDPNANLQEQETIYARGREARTLAQRGQDGTRLKELKTALREWLKGGGFEPDWSKSPVATKYFKR